MGISGNGHNFIGFEKDPIYWEKSVKRVKNEQAQLTLF